MSDKVNIVIPTYNYGRFIKDAIESALSQTYKNIRITILDNASTDNTKEVVKPYLKRKNVRYIRNKKNLGFIGNLEKALRINKDPYLCFLAADDMLAKNAIELELKYLKKFNVGLAQGNIVRFLKFTDEVLTVMEQVYFDRLTVSNKPLIQFHISGMFFDMKKLKEFVGSFRGDFMKEAEYGLAAIDNFNMEFTMEYGYVFLPQFVSYWREHGNNIGFSFKGDIVDKAIKYYIRYDKLVKNNKMPEKMLKSQKLLDYSYHSLFLRDRDDSIRNLIMSKMMDVGIETRPKFWLIVSLLMLPKTISLNIITILRLLYYKFMYKHYVNTSYLLAIKRNKTYILEKMIGEIKNASG